MRLRITLSVLAVLLAAIPRGATAQHVRGHVVEPETLALTVKRPHAAPISVPRPAVVGGYAGTAVLGPATAPLPARSMASYLCDQARTAIMQGMLTPDDDARLQSYRNAEEDARQAMALDSASVEARYWVAAAEGMRAGFGGLRHRLQLGEDVYHQAQSILETDPANAGGHYLLGRLNIEIMNMNGLARFVAGDLLGAGLIRQASWKQAEDHLLAAVQGAPRNAMYRLALARVYAATHRDALARAQLDALFTATDRTPITPLVQAQGHALLISLHPHD